MERNEISVHEARIFTALSKGKDLWLTSKELAMQAHVAWRTARAHALRLVQLGILDVAEVFPAHKYRLSGKAEKRNAAYMIRLTKAVHVFSIQ